MAQGETAAGTKTRGARQGEVADKDEDELCALIEYLASRAS